MSILTEYVYLYTYFVDTIIPPHIWNSYYCKGKIYPFKMFDVLIQYSYYKKIEKLLKVMDPKAFGNKFTCTLINEKNIE